MFRRIARFFRTLVRFHLFGSLAIVVLVATVISGQIGNRTEFADSELHRDVMERWGAPIDQPAPSVRYVESGAVFNTLTPLPLDSQRISLDATMNYRKRGLVYFSGFDFAFHGAYAAKNPTSRDIDAVFVFPLGDMRHQVMLSDLRFRVNDADVPVGLAEQADKLVWTGRLAPGEAVSVDIAFKGRGLDAYAYRLDPALPVHQFQLDVRIHGGRNIDYAAGVVPAHEMTTTPDEAQLAWKFASLESGVPVGVVLPSVQAWDELIARMVARSVIPALLFLLSLAALSLYFDRPLAIHETYLFAAAFAFFFVFLAYVAAFLPFAAAFALAHAVVTTLIVLYSRAVFGARAMPWVTGLVVSFLFVPCLAVVLEGYTGLIYCLEILGALAVLMRLTTVPSFRHVLERFASTPELAPAGAPHA